MENWKGGGERKYGDSEDHSRGLELLPFKVNFHLEYWCLTLKEIKAVPLATRSNQLAIQMILRLGQICCWLVSALLEINTKSAALPLYLYSSHPFHLGWRSHPYCGLCPSALWLCGPWTGRGGQCALSFDSVWFLLHFNLIVWSLCLSSSVVGTGSLVPHSGETTWIPTEEPTRGKMGC